MPTAGYSHSWQSSETATLARVSTVSLRRKPRTAITRAAPAIRATPRPLFRNRPRPSSAAPSTHHSSGPARRATSRAEAAKTSAEQRVKGTSFQMKTTNAPVGGAIAISRAIGAVHRPRQPSARSAVQVYASVQEVSTV